MKIFITGNMGYVGSTLTRFLKKTHQDIELIGYDTSFFGHSLTGADFIPEKGISIQHLGDIRSISHSILKGVDAIVHLAGVSNDPIGHEFEDVTSDINQHASVKLAKMASLAGVKNFVFASSCSMYGNSSNGARKESDTTNPLTAYALSKIGTENELKNIDLGEMNFTSLRFATACGWSNRLRLDLVLNDFVACAITSGEITVLSDGTPWRPLIDVDDMSRAITWAIFRPKNNGGQYLAVNAGSNSSNYQVKQIATTVAKLIPKTKISINKSALPDKRSYSVDFSLYQKLAPDFQPVISLEQSIIRLRDGLIKMNFIDKNFRESSFMRLNTLRSHIKNNRIGKDLYWKTF
ncbi:SDR family oxidoreductase [Candidatus Pelagibacter sp.]|nr:SDR family oxidoreductase [Candidatus Pelagibacter sp.]